MRILEVRFKNLNSLVGEWMVDFTDPAYSASGIFVITGPTGAGKTTIMDAVCLALYGRTPRLNKVTRTDNEVMSRQTGECYAEVVFETQTGRYRCHWAQHRARRRPDGELQIPRHEIADADSGRIIESRLRDVEARIEKVTGMDFERFTRSMLLAQGGFAAFLSAPPEERAPILEQITGTGIYSQISIKVHERRNEEKKKLENLQKELEGVRLLGEDEEIQLHRDLQANEDMVAKLGEKVQSLHRSINWLNGISDLKQTIASLREQQEMIDEKRRQYAPQMELLERALRAMTVESDHVKVTGLRDQLDRNSCELDGSIQKLPVLEADLAELAEAKQARAAYLDQVRTLQKQEAVVIRRVREMDSTMLGQKISIEKLEGELELLWQKDQDMRNQIKKLEEALSSDRLEQQKAEDYLAANSSDGDLVEKLEGINFRLDRIMDANKLLAQNMALLEAAAEDQKAAEEKLSSMEAGHHDLTEKLREAETVCQEINDEIAAILQGREPDELRAELQDGREREQRLINVLQILKDIMTGQDRLRTFAEDLAVLTGNCSVIDQEIQNSKDAEEAAKGQVNLLEKQMLLLKRIRDLEEERAYLEDGTPCPLCGSTEHPFAQGNIPEMDETESALMVYREKLAEIIEHLTDLRVKRAENEKDLQRIKHDIEGQQELLADYEEQRRNAMEALNIQCAEAEYPERLQSELISAGNTVKTLSDAIIQLNKREKSSKKAEKAAGDLRSTFLKSEKDIIEAAYVLEMASKEHQRLSEEQQRCHTLLEDSIKQANEAIGAYIAEKVTVESVHYIRSLLEQRRDKWKHHSEQRAKLQDKNAEQNQEVQKLKALLIQLDKDREARQKDHDEALADLKKMEQARFDLYGDKDPDVEEQRIEAEVLTANLKYEEAREELNQTEHAVKALKENIERLAKTINELTNLMNDSQMEFVERLHGAGFENEDDFLSARLSLDERERLTGIARSLADDSSRIETLLKDKEKTLQEELQKDIVGGSPETLGEDLKKCELELKEVQQRIGAAKDRLTQNENLRARKQKQVEAAARQSKECQRWDALHELIGSADGKKYRNFAQGLTFEMMIAHANRQLQKLTDRYLLVRDDDEPLELNVIDSYQAGEIRSTRNLSGGESFITSLALALGLSQMASRNVRVDSLFLDEGFGTLDEDVLETAVDTLAGLHQEGKLIGIISHVQALRERIGTEIQVVPKTGGNSRLIGPGCRQIV